MLKAEIEWELLGNHALRVVNHAGVANLVTDVTVPRYYISLRKHLMD